MSNEEYRDRLISQLEILKKERKNSKSLEEFNIIIDKINATNTVLTSLRDLMVQRELFKRMK